MVEDQDKSQAPSQQLGQLSVRLIIKTLIKCVIWFGIAWIITRIWPNMVWPWYVAWIFVAIGMGASLLVLTVAFMSRNAESRSDS